MYKVGYLAKVASTESSNSQHCRWSLLTYRFCHDGARIFITNEAGIFGCHLISLRERKYRVVGWGMCNVRCAMLIWFGGMLSTVNAETGCGAVLRIMRLT